jgi:8-oxo-dGTP diphosphatase
MLRNILSKIWRRFPAGVRRWSMRLSNARFTATAGAVILNKQRKVLLLKHFFRAGSGWGIPGGFIHHGEQPIDALRRELQEEIGLEIDHVEFFWARSFKRPRQIELLFRGVTSGEPKIQSMEVEHASWFALDGLPPGLPADQKLLIERAVENWQV